MPDHEVEVLGRWGNGDFYPLNGDERGALDDLADEMAAQPDKWWKAFQKLLPRADRATTQNLSMPFGALLRVGGERMWDRVAEAARTNRKIANAFWDSMTLTTLTSEAHERLGRRMAIDAFVRHEPRIPSRTSQPWPDQWEDEWSGDALFYLTEHDPDEAWAVALELLATNGGPPPSTVGAFIIEELLHDHGDAFIDLIEAEAETNDRLRMALPAARWQVPEHLLDRTKAAAGPYWKDKS